MSWRVGCSGMLFVFQQLCHILLRPYLYKEAIEKYNFLWYFYRPQRSCGMVMFLHLSVILSTGGGLCVWQTPPGQTPPAGRHPLGRHPPWANTHLEQSHPPETATAADGTHPTGMHSCCEIVFIIF